jgi:hypothetical protein
MILLRYESMVSMGRITKVVASLPKKNAERRSVIRMRVVNLRLSTGLKMYQGSNQHMCQHLSPPARCLSQHWST